MTQSQESVNTDNYEKRGQTKVLQNRILQQGLKFCAINLRYDVYLQILMNFAKIRNYLRNIEL